MTDRLEQALRDMRFEVPDSVITRAIAAAEVHGAEGIERLPARRPRPASRSGEASGGVDRRSRSMTVATVVAVLLVAALLAALLYGAQAIRSRPVPVTKPVGASDISQPAAIAAPFAPDCSVPHNAYGCGMQAPVFANANVGWLTAGYEGGSGPTNLYRTTDGGSHWTALISWDGPGAAEIKTSNDGLQALIVTGWGPYGPAILSTSDGGQHWRNAGIPIVAFQCISVAGLCQPALQSVFFRDTREGWLFDQGPTLSSARLYHTPDSGAHWTLASTIDLSTQFAGLNPVGVTGQFSFASSTNGWFAAQDTLSAGTPLTVYRTTDGGATWHLQQVAAPTDSLAGLSRIEAIHPFDSRSAAIELVSGSAAYVATTADGGSTWEAPRPMPVGNCGFSPCALIFVDAREWIAQGRGTLLRTTDAGANWQTVNGSLPAPCCLMQFTDVMHGWLLSGNELYRTTDGGVRWAQVGLPESGYPEFPA